MDADTLAHRTAIKSLPQALMDYFGKAGKDTSAFMAELKALSDIDKAEYREMLKAVGYNL
jgi:uncharacterized protein YcgL (UPF0745 family)